jgi:hypothetical protein
MGALLAGIACLLIAFLVVMPYVLHIILLIAGILLCVYGVYLLFIGGGPRFTVRRR